MRHFALTFVLSVFAAAAFAGEPDSRHIELALVKSLQAVSNSRLDIALNEVDAVLKANPNFKLAQLLKGDLLMAHAQPLKNFGNAPNATGTQLQDLRDEAKVRLQRIQEQRPLELPPRFLWQLNSQQHFALVVDIEKSTLYLYENVNGEPRYVADYYVSVGKKGADKLTEGDQRTPLGVYFVSGNLPREKLTDFYGAGAYPLNYPNEWDKRQGREGHGIWLHGTPSDTYSRPPRASSGCVVLGNNDLVQVSRHLQIGHTPIIITNQMDWSDEQDLARRDELLKEIEAWRKDWSSLNTEAYLAHYANDFATPDLKFSAFAQQKRAVNAGKSWINVQLANISVFPYPSQPDLVVVNFEQNYTSSNLNNRMNKRQYWMNRNGRWQIVYEGAA